MSSILDIERAIDALSPQEIDELYRWLDEHHPQSIDARIESDIAGGHLDKAILRALEDENSGRIKPPRQRPGNGVRLGWRLTS